jgi:aminoglycoside phosphotransferase (APT) family kinase protein
MESVGGGSRITALRRLPLGGWHVNHALDVLDRRAQVHRLVLRRWARPGWELDDPDFTAGREADALTLLADSAVPAPRLVAADPEPAVCDVPALLITRIRGRPPGHPKDMEGFLIQLAAALPPIHAVDGRAASVIPVYRRYAEPDQLELPAWVRRSHIWDRALQMVRAPAPPSSSCLIHRDYHPENTLWLRGRLSGIVDWTQASWGPPAVDLAHMRWNLAVEYEPRTADQFLDFYQTVGGEVPGDLWYWDLVTVMDLFADGDTGSPLPLRDLTRLKRFVAAALAHH